MWANSKLNQRRVDRFMLERILKGPRELRRGELGQMRMHHMIFYAVITVRRYKKGEKQSQTGLGSWNFEPQWLKTAEQLDWETQAFEFTSDQPNHHPTHNNGGID